MTGASGRNWASFGADIALPDAMPDWQRHILCDPQTSGGLLVSVAQDRAKGVLATIKEAGYPQAAIIGKVENGNGKLIVV